uniref:Uncharacterized protein n=1 Tax=Bubo bubo TaxID=30461 RepID=A0A8C0EQW7_BUBBB
PRRAGVGRGESPPRLASPLQLSEPQGSPGFLLFLCRLLSPVLRTYARAVAFLDRPSWPQPGRTLPGWTIASPTTPAPPLAWLLGKLRHSQSSLAMVAAPHSPCVPPPWGLCPRSATPALF